MIACDAAARDVKKIAGNFLTAPNRYGTNYDNDEYTRDVDSVFRCLRGLWWAATGDLKADASPLRQPTERPKGLSVRESLFLSSVVFVAAAAVG